MFVPESRVGNKFLIARIVIVKLDGDGGTIRIYVVSKAEHQPDFAGKCCTLCHCPCDFAILAVVISKHKFCTIARCDGPLTRQLRGDNITQWRIHQHERKSKEGEHVQESGFKPGPTRVVLHESFGHDHAVNLRDEHNRCEREQVEDV